MFELCEGTKIRVYDNESRTLDRYSVVLYGYNWDSDCEYRSCLGMCKTGKYFSQFGTCLPGVHLGKLVSFESLDLNTQIHIRNRLSLCEDL